MKTQYRYSIIQRLKDWITGPLHSASTRYVRHFAAEELRSEKASFSVMPNL